MYFHIYLLWKYNCQPNAMLQYFCTLSMDITRNSNILISIFNGMRADF